MTTLEQKRQLCAASAAWNAKDPTFKKLFPELVDGTLFEDPSKPVAPPPPPAPAPAPTPAPVPPPEVVEPEAEAEAAVAPGEGKNAAKNKKKREKERAKRLAAAGTGAGQDGAEAAEVGAVVDAATAGLAAAAITNE